MITPTPNNVLDMLRKLPPRERLKVISQALPEIEQSLSEKPQKVLSLRGLWKDLRPAPSAKDIGEARQEMWKDFPREDVA
ncbi:MAG: hypothetical protein EHM81_12220 [Chloroflexi bacterium]|nr:MAG: hypothetical protein EHM81_12220 [Chloroflexota bacterium]